MSRKMLFTRWALFPFAGRVRTFRRNRGLENGGDPPVLDIRSTVTPCHIYKLYISNSSEPSYARCTELPRVIRMVYRCVPTGPKVSHDDL